MGQIKRKQSYGIINFPDPKSEMESIKLFCPICTSLMQKWIVELEYDKPMTVPNKLQCLKCGEIVTIYHPSALS
jgi:hypothetical protein